MPLTNGAGRGAIGADCVHALFQEERVAFAQLRFNGSRLFRCPGDRLASVTVTTVQAAVQGGVLIATLMTIFANTELRGKFKLKSNLKILVCILA